MGGEKRKEERGEKGIERERERFGEEERVSEREESDLFALG